MQEAPMKALSSKDICAAMGTTEDEVDCATRIIGPAPECDVFYVVKDPAMDQDFQVHSLTGIVTCNCGEELDCWHRRAAATANLLFAQESTERSAIDALINQGYTRQSAEAHVYRGAPLVESPEEEDPTRVVYTAIKAALISPITPSHQPSGDADWDRQVNAAQKREQRAFKKHGPKCYQPTPFRLLN